MIDYTKFVTKYGFLFGIACIGTFLASSLTTFLLYPGYDIFTQTISCLGTHPQFGFIFNLGTILSGILLLPFHYSIHIHLSHDSKQLASFRWIISVLSAFAFLNVGLFPDLSEIYIIMLIHRIAAATFFLTTGAVVFFVIIEIAIFKGLKSCSNWVIGIGFLTIATELVFGALSLEVMEPFLQKVTVFAYILWSLTIAWNLREIETNNSEEEQLFFDKKKEILEV